MPDTIIYIKEAYSPGTLRGSGLGRFFYQTSKTITKTTADIIADFRTTTQYLTIPEQSKQLSKYK